MAYEYGTFTLKDFENLIDELQKHPRPKPNIQMPADDYPFLSDEAFIVMCNTEGVVFIGGMDGCNKMKARCKRLNIKVN